jgi:hypothetical protein
MSLRDELEEILTRNLEDNYAWRSMMLGDGSETTIKLSGPLEETMQAAFSALNAYCDALLEMVMRVADAMDDLGDGADIDQQIEPPPSYQTPTHHSRDTTRLVPARRRAVFSPDSRKLQCGCVGPM